MDRERWQHIEAVFAAVEGLEGTALERALDHACAGDRALRAQVRRLLLGAEDSQRHFAHLAAQCGIEFEHAEALLNAAGRRIGPYRLVRMLGRGGMGVVYLAERADEQFQKRVALKMLPVGLVTREAVERFHRERQILANLEHPFIARLLDGGVTGDGTPFHVMEYVAGVPLDRYCRDENLSLARRLELFDQICEAVDFAHQNLTIHRDLKPANILVGADGTPKLLDFGVAKLLDDAGSAEATATALERRPATPAYAAPEILRGDSVSTACDVYSLGVILFELVTGGRPYGDRPGRDPGWPERVIDHPPPLASRATVLGPAWTRELRGDLDAILNCCLQADPMRRYRSVAALRADLERHRAHLPVHARLGTRRYRVASFLRRHRAGLTITAGFVAVMLSGLASTSYYAWRAGHEARDAQLQRDRAQAVSDFLVRIFSASDPRQNLGVERSAAELLDEGARSIHHEKGIDPAIRERLTHLMGTLYLHLAHYDESRRLLEEALAQLNGLPGANAAELGAIRLHMGERDYYAGDLDSAESQVREALTRFQALGSGQQSRVSDALQLMGLVLQERGRYAEARRSLTEALAIRRDLYGERHVAVARTLDSLGFLLEKQGEFDEAGVNYRAALDICRKVLEEGDPFTASVINDLGRLYSYQHRFQESLDLHREALAINRRVFGDRHPQTAISLQNIGMTLYGMGRFNDAESRLTAALKVFRERLGPDHWLTARAESVLAELYSDMGRYPEAEPLIDHALQASREAYGDSHRSIVLVLLVKGYLLERQHRYADAEAVIRRSAEVAGKCCSSLALLDGRIHARLAVSLAGQGKRTEAERLMERYCPDPPAEVHVPADARLRPCDYARIRLAQLDGETQTSNGPSTP